MATRNLDTRLQGAFGDPVFQPFYALALFFDEGTVRFWTGVGDLVLGGITYTGLGNLLEISSVDETSDLSARGIDVTLSGVQTSLLSLALSSQYQGRKCILYFGAFSSDDMLKEDGDFILTEAGDKIKLELTLGGFNTVFVGYMDKMDIQDAGETSTITLKVENKLIDLERPRNARYNQGYQQSIYPNDKGFNYVADLQDKEIVWGGTVD